MLTPAFVALVVIGALMSGEAWWSRRNERRLTAAGAVEPPGDVYRAMQVVYPGSFVAMAVEAWWTGQPSPRAMMAGAAVFVAAKLLKYWAMAWLGERWSFRVLVVEGAPLVTSGPYRLMRHPNYVAVVGEFVGAMLGFGAVVSGPLSLAVFAGLLRRRVAVEDAALGRG